MPPSSSSEAPLIETERLSLRRPGLEDADRILAMLAAEPVGRFLGSSDAEQNFQKILRNEGCWSFYGYGSLLLSERATGRFVGQCGLFHARRGLGEDFDPYPEAGWVIDHEHWGQGYALEAMRAIIDWARRDHGISRIVAIISEDHDPSIRVAERLGFEDIGAARYKDAVVRRFAWTAR